MKNFTFRESIVLSFVFGVGIFFLVAATPIKDLVFQGNADAGGFQVTNLATPTSASSAATKGYADTTFLAATSSVGWTNIVGTPATLAGYGITNAATNSALLAHVADTNNPHGVVKAQIGLGNVDNTADTNKPVSLLQQAALDLKLDDSQASAFGLSLLDDADANTGRATLGLSIGTNVQAWDADLDVWATKVAPTGVVVGTTDAQTLTGKSIAATQLTGSLPAGNFPALTGDVTNAAGSLAMAIPTGSLANVKFADVPTATFKGRATAGTGVPEDITPAQARTLLNVQDGATTNSTDGFLLSRTNHTGTQVAATVSDFSTAADARIAAANIDNLSDVAITAPVNNQVLKYFGAQWINSAPSGGAFITLSDTPTNYTGQAGKVAAVNPGETALEFIAVGGTGTVTSVGLSAPGGFTVTGSPVTAAGTLALGTTLTGYVSANGTNFSAAYTIPGGDITGAYTNSAMTLTTARLLGRTTAATGAAEEITVGSGLNLSAGALTATGASLLTATATIDWPSIPAVSDSTMTITVTGAATANTPAVVLGWSADLPEGVSVKQARVTSANTVSITLVNVSGGALDPASMTVRATIFNN